MTDIGFGQPVMDKRGIKYYCLWASKDWVLALDAYNWQGDHPREPTDTDRTWRWSLLWLPRREAYEYDPAVESALYQEDVEHEARREHLRRELRPLGRR